MTHHKCKVNFSLVQHTDLAFFIWIPKHLLLSGKLPWRSSLEQKLALLEAMAHSSIGHLTMSNWKVWQTAVHSKEGHKLNSKSSKHLQLHIDKWVMASNSTVIQTLQESTGCSVSQGSNLQDLIGKTDGKKITGKSRVTRQE